MIKDSKPFLWNYVEKEENDLKSSGGGESKTASANEESKNSLIVFN